MFFQAQRIAERTYETMAVYIEVVIIYLIFSTILEYIQRRGEKKLGKYGSNRFIFAVEIMEKTDPLLRISHVRKFFGTLEVLKDISIDVYKGDVVLILRTFRLRKSQFAFKVRRFFRGADSGCITLDDATIDLKVAPRGQFSEVQRKTGFVFQNYNLFRNETALENITLGLTSGRGVSKEDADKKGMMLLRKIGLEDRANFYPSELWGGQRRVAVARALAPILKSFISMSRLPHWIRN